MANRIKNLLSIFGKSKSNNQRGASLTGYGLVVGLISVVAIGAVSNVGGAVSTLFGQVSNNLEAVSGSGGSSSGDNSPLFSFTSHTFTSCGTEGRLGPDVSDCTTAYSAESWASSAHFGVTGGIQTWTVPETGTYQITALGAQGGFVSGGNGGLGASAESTFSLTINDQISILVGQQPENTLEASNAGASGGGGGSFVILNNTIPLVIAGGGGGTRWNNGSNGTGFPGNAATIATNGKQGSPVGSGGSGGDGGTAGISGGGGGFNSGGIGNGGTSIYDGDGGTSFLNGGTGGFHCTTGGPSENILGSDGGFGGGGGSTWCSNSAGAGGGGYSGGGGGGVGGGGGGGGSFVASDTSGTDGTNAGVNTITGGSTGGGHGTITIVRQ